MPVAAVCAMRDLIVMLIVLLSLFRAPVAG